MEASGDLVVTLAASLPGNFVWYCDGLTILLRCIRIIQDMNTFYEIDPTRITRSLQRLLILQNSIFWLFLFISMGVVFPLTLLNLKTVKDRKAPGIDLSRI